MKIGIIGASGFIGKNLYENLKKEKSLKLIRFSSYKKEKKNWVNKVSKEIFFYKPEIIINCSSSQLLNDDEKSIRELINTNIVSQSIFLKNALKNKQFKSFITFGTKWELNSKGKTKPTNFYAATKLAVDEILKFFSLDYKLSIYSLKIFDTYGKNDKRKKFLNLLKKNYKKNKLLKMTAGNQLLDLVNIDDLVDLIKIILRDIFSKKKIGFFTYTVSSNKPIKLKNLVKKLMPILNKKLKISIGSLKYRSKEPMQPMIKTYNYPGWKPKRDLINELKKIFDNV